MWQSMGLQRVGYNLVTEWWQIQSPWFTQCQGCLPAPQWGHSRTWMIWFLGEGGPLPGDPREKGWSIGSLLPTAPLHSSIFLFCLNSIKEGIDKTVMGILVSYQIKVKLTVSGWVSTPQHATCSVWPSAIWMVLFPSDWETESKKGPQILPITW